VFSSNYKDVESVNKYSVDWDALSNSNTLILEDRVEINLLPETGSSVTIQNLQGGVLSPTGQLLYLVAGHYKGTDPTWGIHVFDLSTRRRVQRSTNGSGYFNYEFHSEYEEEPEGITIWDLDEPKISGQLHVLMLDNDEPGLFDSNEDDIYLKHYTNTICVDHAYIGEEQGTPAKPFNTVGEANTIVWDGARIKIKSGFYPEILTLATRIQVVADGGTVIIGQ
jgi:hypothetical protein